MTVAIVGTALAQWAHEPPSFNNKRLEEVTTQHIVRASTMEALEEEGKPQWAADLSLYPRVPRRIGGQVLASKDRTESLGYEFVAAETR